MTAAINPAPFCPARLARLYAQARYWVGTGGEEWRLQIGHAAEHLECRLGATHYLYITAWNPHSQAAGARRNREADQALRRRLADNGFRSHPAWSSDARGSQREHGWLVLDLRTDQADALACDFGQAGILCWRAGQPVRLRMQAERHTTLTTTHSSTGSSESSSPIGRFCALQ